ncbi:MAG TPA: hypothetical protein VIH52_03750 [Candidatus Nanoarchaeia archaeon]|nr:hypothetical protein [uncultured archaeon]
MKERDLVASNETEPPPITGHAHGDCGTCEIALLFSMGKISLANQRECTRCQRKHWPEQFASLRRRELLRRLDGEVARLESERDKTGQYLEKRLAEINTGGDQS